MINLPGHTVLILDGPEVVTGRGAVVACPQAERPAVVMERIADRFGGDGVLLLTRQGYDPPAGFDSILDLPVPWEVSGKGPWFTVRNGERRVRVGYLADLNRDNDPLIGGDLITTACRHQMWHDLTGVPFYADGGTTSSLLMDATIYCRGRDVLKKWVNTAAPKVTESPWLGEWGAIPADVPHVTLDRNAQYLAAARECLLPLDGLDHTGLMPHDKGTGYFRVVVPENPEPRLPHPYGAGAEPGTEKWVTNVTRELGGPVRVLDSWTCTRDRSRRLLDGVGRGESGKWYERLRDARKAVIDGQDPDSLALQQAVKDTYSRGVDHLAKAGRRWFRPDWAAMLRAKARADMYRALLRAGEGGFWPVATLTDTVTYPGTVSPLRLGSGMGEWKVAG